MIRIFCLFLGIGITFAAPFKEGVSYNPWQDFRYHVQMDVVGKYWMFWTPDDETQTVTFEVHVEALGYVGFGISPNGGMTRADVVIGWVLEDGTPVFHDRHALGEYEPIIDESQDVTLLAANQNDTHTILRFSRPYVTCDENDRDITDDTIRVIYSFTDTDPEDITGLDYHGSSNRGTRSVVLLYYNDVAESLPDDVISMDIVITEHTVPKKRTTYWCEFIKVQQLEQKHHVVMFEPVLHPGNEGLVHHIVLYACYGDMDDDHHGQAWDCIYNVMPGRDNCYTVAFVWAVGGNPFYFPNHTGVPLFSPADNTPIFMMMEIHYDNPENIEGRLDQSGFRLHMTPTLRENDIGVMIVGASVEKAVMIPPHYNDLTYRGYCMPECLQTVLNTTDDVAENDQMNVFAIFHHSHLLGSKMKTRIYRDGAEIEPLLDDANYDFNFQETRKLKEERLIHPTDIVLLDCGYDSSGRDTFTLGGFATVDEMCESFLYYYPAHTVTSCVSHPPYYETIQMIDDITLELSSQFPFFWVTGPPQYANMSTLEVLETLDWTNSTIRDKYQDIILRENAHMARICATSQGGLALPYKGESPELGDDWIDPDDGQCEEMKYKRKIKSIENVQHLNEIGN